MGRVWTFLHGLWRGLDGLRRFLHLLLLLAIFGFLIGVVRESLPPGVPQRAALVVAPQGQLVEQLAGDAVERAIEKAQGEGPRQTPLWPLVDAIRGAAGDDRIRVLVLDLGDMGHAGLPMLEELSGAIAAFRASGKPVIVYGRSFDRDQYYLAAQATQIDLDPSGYVLIRGYSRFPLYFAGLLKKLGVDVNVFRVGKYKSAVEIFTRSSMSKADREQSLDYLDALWSTYQREVTAARKLPADALAKYLGGLQKNLAAANGDAAQVALQAGLVTALEDRRQVERQLVGLVGRSASGTFNAISAERYADIVHQEHRIRDNEPRVGVIVAAGDIVDGDQPPGTIGGDSLSRLIRKARLDSHIKAVVLRIDSPGGSVSAAEEIYQQLQALRASGKPLVVSMGNVAASGGYYIAAPANEIWASPATITGSIGIFAILPDFTGAMHKLGISSDGVGTTALAGQFNPTQPLSDEARALIQSQIDRGYEQFVARVASGRHRSPQSINALGQGRVWAGVDALHNGLIDHLGSLEDAEAAAAGLAKLKHYRVQFIHPHLSWAQQLVQQAQAQVGRAAVSMLGPQLKFQGLSAVAGEFSPYTAQLAELARFGRRDTLYAYCFCSIQ